MKNPYAEDFSHANLCLRPNSQVEQEWRIKMGDSAKSEGTSKITKFWNGVKVEFKKITWPDKDALLKQSIAVVVISVVIGAIITILDFGLQYGVDFLTTFSL